MRSYLSKFLLFAKIALLDIFATKIAKFIKKSAFQKKSISIFFIFFSYLLVSFAQPDWNQWSCILTSCVGYALFWKGMLTYESKKKRFFLAFLWFASVEAIHLNWFLADRYVGIYIYPFIALVLAGLGCQFGLLSLLISQPEKLKIHGMLGISGGWTLLEWSRLFVLSGFSWDPTGLQLTGTLAGMQMASLCGVYGLSLWIFFTNLLALKLINSRTQKDLMIWGIAAAFPYFYGVAHLGIHSYFMHKDPTPPLKALLIQTSLNPEQKMSINGSIPLTPREQWDRILKLLSPYFSSKNDMIILSEGAVPFGTDLPIYSVDTVYESFKKFFDGAHLFIDYGGRKVGNRYWSQSLANTFQSSVIIGLEDYDVNPCAEIKAYNAAFIFHPFALNADRYEKRILVPMGEYIPFNWCKKILSKYGIADSYSPGSKAKVFQTGTVKSGVSICYEETYGNLMRDNRKRGAEVLINLTNDVWYPRSRLPLIHLMHGRLRAVEVGIPLLRACNTGVTCGIDALGRVVDQLPFDCALEESMSGVLPIKLPLYHYATLYTFFGDLLVICASSLLFCIFIFLYLKKHLNLKSLNLYLLRKN